MAMVKSGHANGARKRTPEGRWLDHRQLSSCPVASDLGELHPEGIVVSGVEAVDDLLEDVEADLLAVVVKARPVADKDGGLAPADDLGQPASRRSSVMNWSTEPGVRPSQPPNQSPVQPMIETTQRGSSPSSPEAYSTRGTTLRSSVKT